MKKIGRENRKEFYELGLQFYKHYKPKGLGSIDNQYRTFIIDALRTNTHEIIECTGLLSEHSKDTVNKLLHKKISKYYIKADDLRHIKNKHGRKSEIQQKQIPITEDDLLKIPEILSVPTSIDLPLSNPSNGQGVRFSKLYPDGKMYCIMVDEFETEELSVKTGYKKPVQGVDVLRNTVPKHNVRNDRTLPSYNAKLTNFFVISK